MFIKIIVYIFIIVVFVLMGMIVLKVFSAQFPPIRKIVEVVGSNNVSLSTLFNLLIVAIMLIAILLSIANSQQQINKMQDQINKINELERTKKINLVRALLYETEANINFVGTAAEAAVETGYARFIGKPEWGRYSLLL